MRAQAGHLRTAAPTKRKRHRTLKRLVTLTGVIGGGLVVLLVVNEAFFPVPKTPRWGRTSHPMAQPAADPTGIVLRVMAYNIWMANARRGPFFQNPERVAEHIHRLAELIRAQQPDLVFLQEVAMESGPGSIDQTPLLAETAGLHTWAFGTAVNTGLPFYRLVRGNAILSRWPLEVVANQPLTGRPLLRRIGIGYRTLWCRTQIGGQEILLASVHLTALFKRIQPVQVQEILDFAGNRRVLLAGDFNAEPHRPAIRRLLDTGRFTAGLNGPPTFKSHDPQRKIDYIFAPAEWELLEYTVIPSDLSDHLPVLATYRIPPATPAAQTEETPMKTALPKIIRTGFGRPLRIPSPCQALPGPSHQLAGPLADNRSLGGDRKSP